jgi:ComF family protein
VRLLLAPFCRVCGDPLPSWRVISAALETCPRCRRASTAIDAARAAGRYEGSLREIIHAFKFEGRRTLAVPLAGMMRTAGASILTGADAVVPVPLHPWRRVRRGFNQADDLARRLDMPVARLLWRVQAATQTGLTSAARRRNLRGAFILSPLAPPVANRVFVLVDDVRTTGATLEACARVLKSAGAKEVRALTAALTTLRPRG